jgi:multidrug resistance efflux pump
MNSLTELASDGCYGPAIANNAKLAVGARMSLSGTVESIIRNRAVRILLALALIAVGIWAFLPHLAYRIAPTAFVNSELVRVTAPIAGRLSPDLPRRGEIIDRSTTVNMVEALSSDRRHLLDLEQQSAVAKDRAGLASRQLADIEAADRDLQNRIASYRSGTIQRLDQEVVEAQAEKAACIAENEQRRTVRTRLEELAKSGYTPQLRSSEAFATQEANAGRCEMADARIQRLRVERDSAQKGVFIANGASDVPYSQQQRDRLALRRQELETEILQQTSIAKQLAAEVTEERSRLDRIGHSDVVLPADHVVWSVLASPGSTVTEGQTILDLADCSHRFVVVDLPEREFEQIKPNAPAEVRLIGSDDWRQGQVRQVMGSAARTDDRLLAAQVPRPTSRSITVEVQLHQDLSETEHSGFCNIGRLAEVRFQRSGLGFVDRMFKSLATLAGKSGRKPVILTTADK